MVAGLNEALLAKAAAGKLLRTDKVRADTTVVEGDVGYPTDSGLLAKGIGATCRSVARIKTLGGASRTRARDRRRSAGRRARSIASKLRLRGAQQRDQAQAVVRRITGELAGIAEAAARDAASVIRNARRALRTVTGTRRGRLHQAIDHLESVVGRTQQVVAQTRSRLAGVMPESAHRVVSLHGRASCTRQHRGGWEVMRELLAAVAVAAGFLAGGVVSIPLVDATPFGGGIAAATPYCDGMTPRCYCPDDGQIHSGFFTCQRVVTGPHLPDPDDTRSPWDRRYN